MAEAQKDKQKLMRPLGDWAQTRTLLLPPHHIGQTSHMAKPKVRGGENILHPWNQGKDVDAGRDEELTLLVQSTTRGQFPPSRHSSPTISVANPRRVHVCCNLSFFNFAQLINLRVLLSHFYLYPPTFLSLKSCLVSMRRRGETLFLFFFFHSISELKTMWWQSEILQQIQLNGGKQGY